MDTVHASIAIVLPYFGKLPNYFPLFLESCRKNPSVDWLFYTDCDPLPECPENVKAFRMSFDDFRARLQKAFDFPICLETPYKLCDFKPTYGDTLAQDLQGYDFWGHCDCDMIFGDIRKFITPEITGQYDRILNCGHLILYRNIPEVCTYYRRQTCIDFQAVLQSPKSHSFDEWPGISGCWRRDGLPCYGELILDDLRLDVPDFRPVQTLPGGFVGPYHGQPDQSRRFAKMKHIAYSWRNGKLLRHWVQKGQVLQEETLYVHFQKRKMEVCLPQGQYPGEFLMVPNRFLPYEAPTPALLKRLCPKKLEPRRWGKMALMTAYYELKNLGSADFSEKSAILSYLRSFRK